MQTSRAIKKRRDDNLLTGWEPAPDHAPSIMREEQPTVARIVALAGLFLILIGLIPILGPRLFRMQQPVIPSYRRLVPCGTCPHNRATAVVELQCTGARIRLLSNNHTSSNYLR